MIDEGMSMSSVPKIVHYCWFGGQPLPQSAQKCIASWRKYLPDYEIREWNESNFDVNAIPYTREAYECGKYAFVSDYARFRILYLHGGIYFDTDVEVIRPMDDLVARGAFMGIEQSSASVGINPGLGMAAAPHMELFGSLLAHYANLHFVDEAGVQIPGTVVKHTTDVCCRFGFVAENRMQQVDGVWIYPNDWFNPLDDATGRLTITDNTRSIHLYAKSWVDNYGPFRIWLTRRLHRIFGVYGLQRLKKLLKSELDR